MYGDKRGNMPFSVIAVTILLLSSVAGIVVADHMRSGNGVEETAEGTRALDSSLEEISSYVNQELGVLILDISRDGDLGSLEDRATVFKERSDSWFDYTFPMRSNGVRTELVDVSVDLGAESMEVLNGESPVGGYIPAYLKGSGTMTVSASSGFGGSVRDIVISTDGSYALPLAAEQGSLFERMVEDGGISISQIMSYELESLAQYRVLNGYGSRTQFGVAGTMSIITESDVSKAYRNALDIIGTMCFRNGQIEQIDAADIVCGTVVIDRSAFYGQCLMSILDDAVLKWYDYLRLDYITEKNDRERGLRTLAAECLVKFFTGEDAFGAGDYIVRFMDEHGIEEQRYRFPGSGTTSVTIDGFTLTVDNPVIDILDQGWIRFFNVHYRLTENYITDTLRSALNTAAARLFEQDLEDVIIHTDPYDDISFIREVSEAYRGMTDGFSDSLNAVLVDSIASQDSYDPFYASIAETVMSHADDLCDTVALRGSIEEKLFALFGDDAESLISSQEIDRAIHGYAAKLHDDLSVYDSLRYVQGNGPSILQSILTEIASGYIGTLGLQELVEDRVDVLLSEVIDNMSSNPYSEIVRMRGTDGFILADGAGNLTRERLDFYFDSDPVISAPTVVTSKCTHMTGFRESMSAGYSTTFEIRLRDCIDYRIESSNSLSSAMGSSVTAACKGMFTNDIVLEISVASGWALAGVQYKASETIYDDIWNKLSVYLEPIIEPLRKVMAIVKEIVDEINACIMEISRYVSDIVVRLFERVTAPLTEMAEWLETMVSQIFGDDVLDMFYSLNLKEQTIGFEYLGYTFQLKFDAASLTSNVKTLFVASLTGPVAGMDLKAEITAKVKGEMHINNTFVTGKASVENEDWKVKISVDPLMKSSKHLLTVSANVRGADITAILPDLDDYNEIGVTLSKIPGIGQALSSIPLPGLGVNIGLDAGIGIKYTAPMAEGILINEYESNPAGDDSGKEWIELFNNSDKTIDLDGYSIVASSDFSKKKMTLSGTISPGEFLVLNSTFLMVNSQGKTTKNGEGLTLKDPDGNIVDRTGTHKDESDNGKTWQRTYDASGEWEFKEGTMGRSNGSYISTNLMTCEIAKEIVWDSVQSAFDKVGAITDTDSLQEVIKLTVKNSIDKVIKKVAGCLVEASVFIKVDVTDPTSTAKSGVRVALRCDSELVEDVLKYIAGKIESVALSMKNPYRIDGVAAFTDNIDLEVTFDVGIQYPRLLARSLDDAPKVDLGVTFRANVSALSRIYGKDVGTPGIECGIRIIDCPLEIIPSKLSPKKGMDHDLWLFRINIEWA
ncbi:MAG: lamin tail domain-containing protein [Thermoplasmata archaeon]|nr:lamin tail domain-containing protein [Thermoplasmata archaeon]